MRRTSHPRLRLTLLPLGLALLLNCVAARGQSSGAGPAVKVRITVAGKDGGPIRTLSPGDLRVSVDGAAQAIDGLAPEPDAPLLLAVVLDASASQERILPGVGTAVADLLAGLLRPGVDRAAVVTFAEGVTVEQALTGDVASVRAAVARARVRVTQGMMGRGAVVVGRPPKDLTMPGSSALWDAVYAVARDTLPRTPEGRGRRAVLLVTDGVDTFSRARLDDAVAAALRSEVAVYALGLSDADFGQVDKGALGKLAERTGGRALFPKRDKDVPGVLARIGDDLRAHYVVSFTPAPAKRGGAPRKLKIEIVNPELRRLGAQVAYPQGYFDGGGPSPAASSQ